MSGKDMVRKNFNKGFTLIELIITIAIMAILTSMTVGGISIINSANARKSATKLDGKFDTLQVSAMTKSGTPYMYIYMKSDGLYCSIIRNKLNTRTALNTYLTSNSNEVQISGSNVAVSATGSASVTLSTSNMLRVAYNKSSGAFICCTAGEVDSFDYNRIILKGRSTYHISLVETTGKHNMDGGA